MGALLLWMSKLSVIFLVFVNGYLLLCNIYGKEKIESNEFIGKMKTFYDDFYIRRAYSRHQSKDDHWRGVMCRDRYGQPVTREEVRIAKGVQQRKNVFLTIGIPTIQRVIKGKWAYYLNTTLSILIKELSEEEKKEVMIVIFCADQDSQKREWIIRNVRYNFQRYIDSGLIHIIIAPEKYYSKIDNLPITYNDSRMRVKWRSKQSLDIAFMFYYMHGLSKFYLHIEDDVRAEDGFYKIIKQDSLSEGPENKKWVMRHYYFMGFIGKLIKSKFLNNMADYLRVFYYEMPPDWIYALFLAIIERSGGEISGSKMLFHHLGHQSSSANTRK